MALSKKGFTLIEIVLALAVIAALGLMIAPAFSKNEQRALEKFALELRADFRYAAKMSVINGRSYSIRFYLEENYYTITSVTPHNRKEELVKRVQPNSIFFKSILLNGGLSTVTYSISGTLSSGAGKVTFGDKEHTMILSVLPVTGRVAVYTEKVDEENRIY